MHVHQSSEDEVGPPRKLFSDQESSTIAKGRLSSSHIQVAKRRQKTKKAFTDLITS
jgi:hypothetical protein